MILGITGGVGAGKSSVLAILEKEYNAKLILADEVGRELMQPGEANYVNIVNAFGKEILNEDQTIDTKKLAGLAGERYDLSIGIEDPMTGKASVRMAMKCSYKNGRNYLW